MRITSSIILISVLGFIFQLFLVTESGTNELLRVKIEAEEFQISAQASPITKEGLQKIVDFTLFISIESRDHKFNFNTSNFHKIVILVSNSNGLILPKNHRYLEYRSLLI